MNITEEEKNIIKRIKLIYDKYIIPIIIKRSPKLYSLISCKKQFLIEREIYNENKKNLIHNLDKLNIPHTEEFINVTAVILTVFNLSLEIKKELKDAKTTVSVDYDKYVIKLLVLYLSLYYNIKYLQEDNIATENDICLKIKENYDEILCENEEIDNYDDGWKKFKELTEKIYYKRPDKWYYKYKKYKKKYIIIKDKNKY